MAPSRVIATVAMAMVTRRRIAKSTRPTASYRSWRSVRAIRRVPDCRL
jgi:hypothetical protein